MTEQLALDDSEAIARAAWRIAGAICNCGDNYHGVHPVLRAIGLVPGIARDQEVLNALVPAMLKPGSRILIAGAADASLLRYFVENIETRPLVITIVDRCPAPLALIARMRLPEGISVNTRRADLAQLDEQRRYDLVLSHDMMNFVSEPVRIAVLSRLRDILAPDGRLLVVVRIRGIELATSGEEENQAWAKLTRAGLADFPDLVRFCGEGLDSVIEQWFGRRSTLQNIRDASEIMAVIGRAGLRIDEHIAGAYGRTLPTANGAQRRRQSHIFVTRPSQNDFHSDGII